MEPAERVAMALELKESDRVPTGASLIHEPIAREIIGKLRKNWDIELWNKLGIDVKWCSPGSSYPPEILEETQTYTISKNEFGEIWKTVRMERYNYEFSTTAVIQPAMKNIDDLDNLRFPDPFDPKRYEYIKFLLNETQFGLVCNSASPVERAFAIRGQVDFLMDMITNEKFAKKLLRRITNFYIEQMRILDELGVCAICIADDIAGNNGLLFSPEMFRHLVLPCYEMMVKSVRCPVIFHSDGNTLGILDDLVRIGIRGLWTIEKHLGMDLSKLKQKYGKKICLIGDIDVHNLRYGNEETITSEVRQSIKICAPGGGYILAPSNTITPDIPAINVIYMYKAAEKYGHY